MGTVVPPCGSPEFRLFFLNLAGGVDPNAARIAGEYVVAQLDPIRQEMKDQVEGIVVVIAFILVFLVIIPLFIFLLWMGYTLEVTGTQAAVIIVLFVLICVALLFYVASTIQTTLDNVLNTATMQLLALDNPNTFRVLQTSLNGAAAEYLNNFGISC